MPDTIARRKVFVQLARCGDCVSILPVAKKLADDGFAVSQIIHPNFASLLDGVSYVKPILFDGTDCNVIGAIDFAKRIGFRDEEIIDSQVNGNPRKEKVQQENFLLTQWALAGEQDRFHDYPLVFDRFTDTEAEAILHQHLPYRNGQPLLVYALHSYSSPFYRWKEADSWLKRSFSGKYRLLDIGSLTLQKPYHLLAFLKTASVLVCADTLHLHLAYATGTPTIVLHPDKTPWYNSEPRMQWVGRSTYDTILTATGQAEIGAILTEMDFAPGRLIRGASAAAVKEPIFHVVDWFAPPGSEETRRNLNARLTWEDAAQDGLWKLVLFDTDTHAARTSRDIGDARKLPFIKDIIAHGVRQAVQDSQPGSDPIVVWTNADTVLCREAPHVLRAKLRVMDCCYSRRVDVGDASQRYIRASLNGKQVHVGADLFAFRVSWYERHKDEIPDLFLSCEGWDFVLRWIMKRSRPDCEVTPPIIVHQRHQSHWAKPGVIHESPAQLHNRDRCSQWAIANGLGRAIYSPLENPSLFKSDGTW